MIDEFLRYEIIFCEASEIWDTIHELNMVLEAIDNKEYDMESIVFNKGILRFYEYKRDLIKETSFNIIINELAACLYKQYIIKNIKMLKEKFVKIMEGEYNV